LSKPFTVAELLDAVKQVLCAADGASIRVEMDFPVIMKAISEIASVEKPAIVSTENQTNLSHRILVVDDDKDTRQLSVDVLTGSGYEVEGVKDGAAGWEALLTYDYDLIITDNKMPRMTGVEMIGKLRSAKMAVPVIMATRHLPTYEFAEKPWLKPDAMLQRPFSNDELLATVKNVLRRDDGSDSRQETLLPVYL
jgi:CheY-like chemotaxis protein